MQHCEGAEPALRGHIHIVLAPAPPPLTIGLELDASGTFGRISGTATVGGTVTCSRPTTVFLSGGPTQRATRFAQATGSLSLSIPCDGTTPWKAQVTSQNSVPFGPGTAQLSVHASAFDSDTGQPATDSDTASVKLSR